MDDLKLKIRTIPNFPIPGIQFRDITTLLADPDAFGEAFAKAWFKLLHRDMGPKSNYVAGDFKDVEYIWQDPVPAAGNDLIGDADAAKLKGMISRDIFSVCQKN